HQVILSEVEHPSIFKQIPLLQSKGYQVKLAPVDESGCIDIDQLENLLSDDVLLLSTMAVNNEVGSVQDLKAISRLLE
ncbi:aminotransferase class V-fold PLP-dependent enzyme, partial [Escherichia coli]|nr:aminotransferase class V-fold PLP-dependent enzyme [Escherichia coli]